MGSVEQELAAGVKLGYRPGLDGLRTFAVVAVIGFHYWGAATFPGGPFGVDLFFVLSGFLISRLLLEELSSTDHLALRRFYLRRIARLYPAVVIVCCVVLLDAFTVQWFGPTHQSVEGVLGALFYATNWMRIATAPGPVLALTLGSPVLGHLWSLAVEEQFYLVWPFVLLVAFRRSGLRAVRNVSAAAFVIAAVETTVRSLAGVSPNTLYNVTDAHPAIMLMAGCWLATVATTTRTPGRVTIRSVIIFALVIAGGLVAVLDSAVNTLWLYRGGFVVVAAAMAFVVARALVPDRETAVLHARPVVWIGQLSYGIYVYHVPIRALVQHVGAHLGHGLRNGQIGVISVLATLASAALSYYLVEQPIRKSVAERVMLSARTRPQH